VCAGTPSKIPSVLVGKSGDYRWSRANAGSKAVVAG